MIKHNFTIKEILISAWHATKKNAWFLALMFFVSVTIMTVTRHTGIIGGLINILIGISIINISLVIASGKTPNYLDTVSIFKNYKIFWHYLIASILCVIIVLGGLILFILPGIYLAVRLQFYKFLIVDDENLRPVAALKKSMKMTKGHFWKLFGFILAIILLNIVGLLVFIIGLAITIPVSVLATAFLYKKFAHAYESVAGA